MSQMSVGSTPGERRGGRRAGTPNKATTLKKAVQQLTQAQIADIFALNGTLSHAQRQDALAIAAVDAADGADPSLVAGDKSTLRMFDGNALLLLQQTYKDCRLPRSMRLDAAKVAIRYESPALQAVSLSGDEDHPITLRSLDARQPLDGRLASLLIQGGVKVVTHEIDDTGEITSTVVE